MASRRPGRRRGNNSPAAHRRAALDRPAAAHIRDAAKGRPDHRGLYQLYPRAAFYALQEAYLLDPYAPDTDLEKIRAHFGAISATEAELKAIDKDPRRRYQTAGEFADDLERFIEGEPIKARRVSLPERFARWSKRNKAAAACLCLISGSCTEKTTETIVVEPPPTYGPAGLTLEITN